MHRLFLRLACLACVTAMAFECESGNPADVEPSGNPSDGPQMGIIHGIVMIADSLLGGAQVSLTGGGVTRTVATGVDGAFMFADVPPGSYTITATAALATCDQASAAVEHGQTTTATIACARIRTGVIAGTVTAGGTPLEGVSVRLRELGRGGRTDASGVFALTSLPPGTYTLIAFPEFTPCESMSVVVEADRTVPANIVCQAVGAIDVAIEPLSFDALFDGIVTLVGPAARERTISGSGSVRFLELPPGQYAVTATAGTPGLPVDCQSAIAVVEVGRINTVIVECNTRMPLVRDIAGQWGFEWSVSSRTGSCPEPLPSPDWEGSTVFITAGAGTVTVAWYWYDITVVGHYEPASGHYAGQGSADAGSGSSIRTEIQGSFEFFRDDFEGDFFGFDGSMKREHRSEPGGNPTCTEEYQLSGFPRR